MGSFFSIILADDTLSEFMERLYTLTLNDYTLIGSPKYGEYFKGIVHKLIFEIISKNNAQADNTFIMYLKSLYIEYKLHNIYYLTYRILFNRISIVLCSIDHINVQTLGDIALNKEYTLYMDGITYAKPKDPKLPKIAEKWRPKPNISLIKDGIKNLYDTDTDDYEDEI